MESGTMALKDELLAKVESPAARWFLVAVGVIVLLRLRLVLFAAALPLMAYWHYSNQQEEQPGSTGPDDADGDGQAKTGGPVTSKERGGGDAPWPVDDEDEDDALFRDDDVPSRKAGLGQEAGPDPYDQSFWGEGDGDGGGKTTPWQNKPQSESAGTTGIPSKPSNGDGLGSKPKMDSWDDGDDDDDLFLGGGSRGGGGGRPPGGDLGGLGGGPKKGASDFDFDFLGGGNDLDMLGSLGGGFGGDDDLFGGGFGGGKGKGKGKGKKGDKGGKGEPGAPREADPKQVFVANVGDLAEDDIRGFFEDVGDVERLKVLRNPDGSSKGVCFVTFASVDQAQKALGLHGSPLEGKNLVVRLAHGGNKGEKGDKGGGKGGDRGFDGPIDLGGAERFGAAFGDRGDRGGGKGGGKGKSAGNRRNERGEMDELLEDALADSEGPLRVSDFDFAARRFLTELRSRDRTDDTQRFQEAIDMVMKYTSSKDRSSVRKWPAYIFTLLQRFDSGLWEELRERDAERKREKGGGGFGSREGGGFGSRDGGGFGSRDRDFRNPRED